jgi:NAD(P)H dehydrogenase (quinone)
MATVLVIGASGSIGSHLVKELDLNHDGISVRLGSSRPDVADRWRGEGRDAVVLDLGKPETFAQALNGVDRVFLLTGYTADMLHQSKMLVDAAVDAGVDHVVHLGVFSSGRDNVPHYAWHDLVEAYLRASGLTWTNLHPNVISDSVLVQDPPITQTGAINVAWGEVPVGWVCAADIAAVAAAVLREGPGMHGGKDYWLSTELLTGPQVADILSETLGVPIACEVQGPEGVAAYASTIESAAARLYMESAAQKMGEAQSGNMAFETVVRDDVATVLGRPGTTVAQMARQMIGAAG